MLHHHHQDPPRSSQSGSGARRPWTFALQMLISQSCVIAVNKIVCGRTDQCDMLTNHWADVCVRGAGLCARAPPAHTPPEPSVCWKGYVSCVVVAGTPQGGGLSVCRCANPAYPLSPTRCWRYRFSYLDFGGDCGWGRCKRPAEARCLPRCQSPRLGSRRLNPLLNSHIQTENDFFHAAKNAGGSSSWSLTEKRN